MSIKDAREIFKPPLFTQEEINRIFAAAAGKTLFFPRSQNSLRHDLTPFLIMFARGENWRYGLPVSPRRFYQKLQTLRSNPSPEIIREFQKRGLVLREIARLFKMSIPTIQRLLNGTGTNKEV
ncbi:MAG: hypothetical protein N2248_00325 [candidate division WOR-3 bacterium]|nr:hypothetical protein [candidate division WOR-3 bacterium]